MELKQTYEIVRALAAGINPMTGDLFDTAHVLQSGDIVRALHSVLQLVEQRITAEQKRAKAPESSGAGSSPTRSTC